MRWILALLLLLPLEAQAINLGDLATPYAGRLDFSWDTQSWWADGVDTELELIAAGWTGHTLSGAGINCAAGGTANSQDAAAVTSQIQAICGAPGGDCGFTYFKLQGGQCTYDFVSAGNAIGDTNGGATGINLTYSNFAILGATPADPNQSRWYCNNPSEGPDGAIGSACIDLATGWGNGSPGASFGWDSGTAQGTTVIHITPPCTGITPPVGIYLTGTNADAYDVSWGNGRIVSIDGSCNATLERPLPTTWTLPGTVRLYPSTRPRNIILMDFTVAFPFAQRSDEIGAAFNQYGGTAIRAHGVDRLLVQNMRIGPYEQKATDARNDSRSVYRHNVVGECMYCNGRDNNHGIFSSPYEGGAPAVYDNYFERGAVRMMGFDGRGGVFGAYVGFNYQDPNQQRFPGGMGGYYCGGERGFFFHADPGEPSIAAALIENNDVTCSLIMDYNNNGRYTTAYKNRIDRPTAGGGFSGTIEGNSGPPQAAHKFANIILNRVDRFLFPGTTNDGLKGRWNLAKTSIQAPVGSSPAADWDSTNYVDVTTAANSACGSLTTPVSLAFEASPDPWWWCTELGSFATFQMGACDGGTPSQLPAERRALGLPCTPPGGGVVPTPNRGNPGGNFRTAGDWLKKKGPVLVCEE